MLSLSLCSHNHTLLITCTFCYDQTNGTQDIDFSCSFSDSLSLCSPRPCLFTRSQSHTHTHSLSLVLVTMMKSKERKTKNYSHAHSPILSHFALTSSRCLSLRLEYRIPLLDHVSVHPHNHTLLITCTCCVDLTKGTQDKVFSYSFSDSLSHCALSFPLCSVSLCLTLLSVSRSISLCSLSLSHCARLQPPACQTTAPSSSITNWSREGA